MLRERESDHASRAISFRVPSMPAARGVTDRMYLRLRLRHGYPSPCVSSRSPESWDWLLRIQIQWRAFAYILVLRRGARRMPFSAKPARCTRPARAHADR